ncbi:MAG: hypothetical protein ACHQ49_06545 [Elusimicrobiota bacterium]
MAEPASTPQPATPAPAPAPGFGELLEQSVAGLVDPAVFRRAASRPAPSSRASAGLAVAAGAAALAINVSHTLISGHEILDLEHLSPQFLAYIGAAALGFYAALFLLSSVLIYVIGNGFGGRGGFDRAVQAAAMLSILAPLQMLCNWFSVAWIAPSLLAAWAGSNALTGLFNSRTGPARVLCALFAAASIGLQSVGRAMTGRAREAYAAARAVKDVAAANADLARSMTALARQAQAAPGASAVPSTSGLDLLRGGDAAADSDGPGSAAPAMSAPPPQLAAAAAAMQTNAAGMLDALTPMLDMLTASKNLPPQQKADIKELQGLMQELKTQMISGKRLDNAVFAQKMSRYQALLLKVMAYSAQTPPAAAGAPR